MPRGQHWIETLFQMLCSCIQKRPSVESALVPYTRLRQLLQATWFAAHLVSFWVPTQSGRLLKFGSKIWHVTMSWSTSKSAPWQYFTKTTANEATCNMCSRTFRTPSSTNKLLTNHPENKHYSSDSHLVEEGGKKHVNVSLQQTLSAVCQIGNVMQPHTKLWECSHCIFSCLPLLNKGDSRN